MRKDRGRFMGKIWDISTVNGGKIPWETHGKKDWNIMEQIGKSPISFQWNNTNEGENAKNMGKSWDSQLSMEDVCLISLKPL